MNETCKAKMGEAALQDMRWRTVWIIGREYYRVKNASRMASWDLLAQKAAPEHNFNDGDLGLNAYAGSLKFGQWTKWFPGWNDATCSFDQKKFACFCYWLAGLEESKRTEVIDKLISSDAPIEHPCAEVVTSDPIYIVRSNTPPPKEEASMWPWLLGLAALGAVGAVVYYGSK